MSKDEILAAITASQSLMALVPDTVALASALSQGRTRPNNYPIGKGDVLAAIGLSAANIVLDAVEQQPEYRHVIHLLQAGRLDSSSEMFVQAVDLLHAGGAMTRAEADKLISMGREPDPVPEFNVRCAIFNDDGSLAV